LKPFSEYAILVYVKTAKKSLRPVEQAYARLALLTDGAQAAKLSDLRSRVGGGIQAVLAHPVLEQTRSQARVIAAVYEDLRAKGVPSQYVQACVVAALATARRGSLFSLVDRAPIPLDDKSISIKGAETVSIAGLDGRLRIRYRLEDYELFDRRLLGQGELVEIHNRWYVRLAVDLDLAEITKKGSRIMTETIMSRVGRVIAGLGVAVVDAAEQATPKSTLQQSLRELDKERETVRSELGALEAERLRIDRRQRDLEAENLALEEKIGLAVEEGRDDLATRGLERQEDIAAQLDALHRRSAELSGELEEGRRALEALGATRRQLESDLQAYEESEKAGAAASGAASKRLSASARAEQAAERAMAVSARLTGVPQDPGANDAGLTELDELARKRRIEEKLAAIKKDLESDR